MPVGLQTFNSDSSLQLDYTDRLCRVDRSGAVNLPAYPDSARRVSIPVDGMRANGAWFVFATEYTNVKILSGRFELYRCDQFDGEPDLVYYTVVKV